MIRAVTRLMSVAPLRPAASESRYGCNTCSGSHLPSTGLSSSASSVSCSCQALEVFNPPESQSVFKACDSADQLQDWEFAGDEEREDAEDVEDKFQTALQILGVSTAMSTSNHLLPRFEQPPSIVEDCEADSALEDNIEHGESRYDTTLQSTECDWLEPPRPPGEDVVAQMGAESIMLEAFHQFQHNPEVQKMVVALATDEGVWRAVLSNEKLLEYRRGSPDGDCEADVNFKELETGDSYVAQNRVQSRLFLLWVKAVGDIKGQLQDHVRWLVQLADKKVCVETREFVYSLMLKSCMMLLVMTFTLIVFFCLLPLQVSEEEFH